MRRVRNAIFDLDGTLIDSLPGIRWSVDAALRGCGLRQTSGDLRRLIGPPVRDILAAVSGVRDRNGLDRLEQAFRASYDSEGWRRTVCKPGVPDMLWQLLTDGLELWVVTNKPALATGKILRELKIGDFFREVVCRDSQTPPWASKAEMLMELARRQEFDRGECLMIGDTAEDWQAAEAAGIRCAIVPSGYGAGFLPPGCRRIGGWGELAEMCQTERHPATREIQPEVNV